MYFLLLRETEGSLVPLWLTDKYRTSQSGAQPWCEQHSVPGCPCSRVGRTISVLELASNRPYVVSSPGVGVMSLAGLPPPRVRQ